jgi:serine/threonine-protein kinase
VTGVHALPPGHRLGQYEIVAPLTSGGMAAVYLGRSVGAAGFQRPVAIKVVHPRFADDPQFVAMFLDEARLSSRIDHANVVRVEALGKEEDLYYLVMEYVRGAALAKFVQKLAQKKRALVPEVVVHLIAQVADGLHAAHETTDEFGHLLGIVHRDVTPQNVLIASTGAVKLIDFGIAKAAGRSHHTAKGMLKGKLRYMAPEQAAGKPVDRRADVYALGIVLWELLTYRRLFSAPNDAALIRIVLDPKVPPPSRFAEAVSPALDQVVLQALAPSPNDRFQTAQAMRRALYEACPAARNVDAADVAALFRSVLADELAKEAKVLPTGIVAAEPKAPIDAPREEAALTRIVQSTDLDDEPAPSSPSIAVPVPPAAAPAPAPRPPSVRPPGGPHARTVFGIGHLGPMSGGARPAPGPLPRVAPPEAAPATPPASAAAPPPPAAPAPASHVVGGSTAGPPSAPLAATRMNFDPDLPASAPLGRAAAPAPDATPLAYQPTPPSAFGAPPPGAFGAPPPGAFGAPAGVTPPSAGFTPASAIPRPVIPSANAPAPAPAPSSAPKPSGSRAVWIVGIGLGALFTIVLGGALGWLALHLLTHS